MLRTLVQDKLRTRFAGWELSELGITLPSDFRAVSHSGIGITVAQRRVDQLVRVTNRKIPSHLRCPSAVTLQLGTDNQTDRTAFTIQYIFNPLSSVLKSLYITYHFFINQNVKSSVEYSNTYWLPSI